MDSRERDGHGRRGFAGHHSWPKRRGGGNKTGATTHAPKEWGPQHRKEEEHLTMLAKQAELDAIAEGLFESAEFDPAEHGFEFRQYMLDHQAEELLEAALTDDIPFVTINGIPLPHEDVFYDDDFYDYHSFEYDMEED